MPANPRTLGTRRIDRSLASVYLDRVLCAPHLEPRRVTVRRREKLSAKGSDPLNTLSYIEAPTLSAPAQCAAPALFLPCASEAADWELFYAGRPYLTCFDLIFLI